MEYYKGEQVGISCLCLYLHMVGVRGSRDVVSRIGWLWEGAWTDGGE